MKKIYLLFSITILVINMAFAQPTLTQANVGPVIGQSFTYHSFTPTTFTPGASGANVTWDFSQTTIANSVTFSYVAPSSTPYASLFPGANIASNQNGTYEFDNISSTAFTRVGVWTTSAVLPYSDGEQILSFPFTMNSTFTDPYATTFSSSGFTFYRTGVATAIADGYGTLILPGSTVQNALRVHLTENYSDSSAAGIQTYSSEDYYWFTPGIHYFLYSLAQVSTFAGTSLAGSYVDVSGSGIETLNPDQISFSIHPNPATNNIQVEYDLKNMPDVSYTITNFIGQNLISGKIDNSTGYNKKAIDVSNLPNGIYFMNIISENKISTRKFVVDKSN